MSIREIRNGRRFTQTRTVQVLKEKGGKLQFCLPYRVLVFTERQSAFCFIFSYTVVQREGLGKGEQNAQ